MSSSPKRRTTLKDGSSPHPKLTRQDSDKSSDSEGEGCDPNSKHSLENPPTHDRSHPKHQDDPAQSSAKDVKQNYPFNRKLIPSLLSSDSPFHNYRGFFHLGGLLLIVLNFRLVVENLLKYGILITPASLSSYLEFKLLVWILVIPVIVLLLFLIQKVASSNPKFTDQMALGFSIVLLALLVIIPSVVIITSPPNPTSAIVLMMAACMTWLKMVSYGMANRQYRMDRAAGIEFKERIAGIDRKDLVKYPGNLTIGNLTYFLVAPTLCYQLNYPRSPKIRWGYVAGKVVQLFFCVIMAIFMIEQWAFPVVKNSYKIIKERHYIGIVERVMKLSVPSLAIWLVMFYAFFHLWLNIIAELLRFGDREFYRDWWNATTMGYYWRTWNIPTHNWLVRHVYMPAIRNGYSKKVAAGLVFLFSAVFHELIISVALKTFQLYFFFGMLIQIPGTIAGEFLKGTIWGNLIFWLSFCFLGQPIGVLLYYFDFTSTQIALVELISQAASIIN